MQCFKSTKAHTKLRLLNLSLAEFFTFLNSYEGGGGEDTAHRDILVIFSFTMRFH